MNFPEAEPFTGPGHETSARPPSIIDDVLLPVTLTAARGRLMNRFRFLLLPLLVALVTLPARAAEPVAPPKEEKLFEVEAVKDLAYNDAKDADPDKQKLDLYLPRGQKDVPVLFFVHGGTWKSGDRKRYSKLGEAYAARGLGVVIISYRLSPKVQHPAHIQDVAKGFAWTCANVGKYGGNAGQIFCCGHSAGGHLVSLLATDESYLKAEGRSMADIKGVISISGVYTILPVGPLATAFGTDLEVCKKASPMNNVGDKHPPFLIVYAGQDYPTLDLMAESMCKTLKDHKCEASALRVESRDHISIIAKSIEAGDPTQKALLDFVHQHPEKK
jgi:acetyl esterase/lipase